MQGRQEGSKERFEKLDEYILQRGKEFVDVRELQYPLIGNLYLSVSNG